MMRIIAIDPGPERSGYVVFDGTQVLACGWDTTLDIRNHFHEWFRHFAAVVFEGVESYGMAVGAETFETVFVTGRLYEFAADIYGEDHVSRIYRKAIKLHLCGSARAKDGNIRVALLDRFGGAKAAKGTKAAPGPLYGVSGHCWAALALAVTWCDQQGGTDGSR
tara:strand:- start:8999 stop:9490 length:492 start_codon:yes stop_codon:yes gene_type:complete